jgi:hypothetical protein
MSARYARTFSAGGYDAFIDTCGQFAVLKIRDSAGELVHKTRYLLGDYSAAKIKQDARAVIAGMKKEKAQ